MPLTGDITTSLRWSIALNEHKTALLPPVTVMRCFEHHQSVSRETLYLLNTLAKVFKLSFHFVFMSPENIHNEVWLSWIVVCITPRAAAPPEPEYTPVSRFYSSFIFCQLSCHRFSLNHSDSLAASRTKQALRSFYSLNYSICCEFLPSHMLQLSRLFYSICLQNSAGNFCSRTEEASVGTEHANMLMRIGFFF